jgi:6-pyruvoyltetrahydropterin/6-carboxytetrahydropterin synthase
MYQVEIKVSFRYGHRLCPPYIGKCSNVHGEYGTAIFIFSRPQLSPEGFVVDFGVAKKKIKNWIDKNWDHAYLHNCNDGVGKTFKEKGLRTYDLEVNPTAENMAAYLYSIFSNKFKGCKLEKVGVVESAPDSIAWYVAPGYIGEIVNVKILPRKLGYYGKRSETQA